MLPFSHFTPALHPPAVGFLESHCKNSSIHISAFTFTRSSKGLFVMPCLFSHDQLPPMLATKATFSPRPPVPIALWWAHYCFPTFCLMTPFLSFSVPPFCFPHSFKYGASWSSFQPLFAYVFICLLGQPLALSSTQSTNWKESPSLASRGDRSQKACHDLYHHLISWPYIYHQCIHPHIFLHKFFEENCWCQHWPEYPSKWECVRGDSLLCLVASCGILVMVHSSVWLCFLNCKFGMLIRSTSGYCANQIMYYI